MKARIHKQATPALSCGRLVGAAARRAWHPPAQTQEAAVKRMQTLIRRLRFRGDDYNADIAELEVMPFLRGSNI